MSNAVECATITVPLDRSAPELGAVPLAVERVEPTAAYTGTILFLDGGPGQAALLALEPVLAELARLPDMKGFELVSFDQRGTGESAPLECPGLWRKGVKLLDACGEYLGVRRGFYTSQDSVEDIEAVREALGSPAISLYGVSYGARVAGIYAREYPQATVRLVLDSPVPLDGIDALEGGRVEALHRVLDQELCGDNACRGFSRDVFEGLIRLLETMHRRPIVARIFDARGKPTTAYVTESHLYRLISLMDLSSSLRSMIPAAIASAVRGRAAALARMTSAIGPTTDEGGVVEADNGARQLDAQYVDNTSRSALDGGEAAANREFSLALMAATLCVETRLPWSPESSLDERSSALEKWRLDMPQRTPRLFTMQTLASQGPVALCKNWPPTPAAPATPSGLSSVPTLILAGGDDLRTPYESDRVVARGYANAQLLEVPNAGHATVANSRCAADAMIDFFVDGRARAHCKRLPLFILPPTPRSVADVRPARAASRRTGQVTTAAVLTIDEVLGQPHSSGGGLIGGYYWVNGKHLIFNRLADVPGVILTGSLDLERGTGQLVVAGRLHGSLLVAKATVRGRVGGVSVTASLAGAGR